MKRASRRIGDLSTRVARRVLREGARRIPVSSQVIGPPRGVLPDTRAWCQKNAALGAQFVLHSPEEKPVVAPPLSLEELPEAYRLQLHAKTPPRFVASIPQGRVCHSGTVLTPNDAVLGDVTYQSKISDLKNRDWPIFQTLKLPPMQRQSGAVGVLASLWPDNYYHWLFDVVPRLHLLRQSEFPVEKFVVATSKDFQKQTLDLLGISENQRMADEPNLHLLAERLIVPSLPGGQGNPPRWICEFLRETLTPAAQREYSQSEHDASLAVASPRRIYISRADASGRRLANETEVLKILRLHEFESVTLENLSVVQQILLFAGVDAVVAPHGAALSNLVFCRPGARVLEFFAPGWIHPVYNFIGGHGDLRCGCLIGKGARPVPQNDARFRDEDITIDLFELKEMLRLLDL